MRSELTWLFVVWLTGFTSVAADGLRPVQPRCEYQENPLGIDVRQPRLSWVLEAEGRNQRQTAYQILVASGPGQLRRNQGDLWDSGKVASSEQNQIAYGGQPLRSNQECFWSVRAWNQEERPGPWSRPARWRMALLEATDWKAKWIGGPFSRGGLQRDARWIWFPEGEPAKGAPPGERYFRKQIEIPQTAEILRATATLAVDNSLELFVNGQSAGRHNGWSGLSQIDLAPFLRPGANVVAIAATNGGDGPNPAGLIGQVVIRFDRETESIPVDYTWLTAEKAAEGWKLAGFDDRGWARARVLGPADMLPWGGRPPGVEPLPLFRKTFNVRQSVTRAVVHVCGLGHYELFLDGKKVGDHFLDPAWSVYEQTVFHDTFELTPMLSRGPHVFGVMLGKGFYNTSGDRRVHGVNVHRPLRLILQAHLTFANGTEEVIVTDGSWRTIPGPITHSAILAGEDYDARLWPTGWDRPGFDDSRWDAAVEMNGPGGALTAAISPPLTQQHTFKPVRIDEPKPGVFVYDFGQNAAAIPRLKVQGHAGQVLKLTPAEQRHGMTPRRNDGRGLVNPAGVGSPNYFQYTLRGEGVEEWAPQFSYTGFQYLQLEGGVPKGAPNPGGLPVVEELLSINVRNDAPVVGEFACSIPLFNQIDRAIDWAVRANMSHVLTDCPHREKLGWLEVAYLMGTSIAGRYDLSRFYSKIARDCADSQKPDGMVPTVAPAYPSFSGGFAYTPEWGAAAVVVPWQVHEWYGDRAVLASSYPTMKGFVDYMHRTAKDLVPLPGLGDWYDYGHGKAVGPSQFTPPELSAMATFRRCTQIVADTAGLLGKTDDERGYRGLAADIARAFNTRWFDGQAQYKNHGSPQTANSMALVTGIAPPEREAALVEAIVADLRKRGNQQTAGDIGYWYLLRALADRGRSDVIFDLVARTNLGSYGFIVNNGWTSLPEAWDADTGASMNHCMLGHIQDWFLGWVAGIRPDPTAPGFARFIVAPTPVGNLTWARGRHNSIRGRISSDWRLAAGRFHLKLTVPPNTRARVLVPTADSASIRERGRLLDRVDGVKRVGFEGTQVVLEVGSGAYEFTASARAPVF